MELAAGIHKLMYSTANHKHKSRSLTTQLNKDRHIKQPILWDCSGRIDIFGHVIYKNTKPKTWYMNWWIRTFSQWLRESFGIENDVFSWISPGVEKQSIRRVGKALDIV